MMKNVLLLLLFYTILGHSANAQHRLSPMRFDGLPHRWDEAIPLGNGMLGALVWEKSGKLRLSLDRADLWDDRPMPDIDQLRFEEVIRKVKTNQYADIQRLGDLPYETYPAPTKLPGAALEFDIQGLGSVTAATLDLETATATVQFSSGAIFRTFIHATHHQGYFEWSQVPGALQPALVPPTYHSGREGAQGNSVEGQGLERLGYPAGSLQQLPGAARFRQPTWKKHFYEVAVQWNQQPGTLSGSWTINCDAPASTEPTLTEEKQTSHLQWWTTFWKASSVQLPDSMLQHQYDLETYKLGCVAREHTPAITLQAIWTADNGSLPPWKGDFHHDLNTQLSYWPTYSGNRLSLAASFTNWLWAIRPAARNYTKHYFQKPGLNVPGVTTISGKPMGGWIQYSMSPTIGAWLSQHFYWEWKYRMDEHFLRTRAYPWLHQTALFLENITTLDSHGRRQLPISSSPEYHDNSVRAWFYGFTNHDLALTHFAFQSAAEAAAACGKTQEAQHWLQCKAQLPALFTDDHGLLIAPGQALDASHRHHAHLISIYPLTLLNADQSADDALMKRSLEHLAQQGTRQWTGYSFAWLASLYAQTRDGQKAADALRIFASNFVSSNTFHLNGDQKNGQFSDFTYRPFTLEGNFAFAQGVHEMLLQSHKGYIEVFPAIPSEWKDIAFEQLRAQGAFLISASMQEGIPQTVQVFSENGGLAQLRLPETAPGQPLLSYFFKPGEKKSWHFNPENRTWSSR